MNLSAQVLNDWLKIIQDFLALGPGDAQFLEALHHEVQILRSALMQDAAQPFCPFTALLSVRHGSFETFFLCLTYESCSSPFCNSMERKQ